MVNQSLNSTPQSERLHIALFGRRNAGKSSLINALTGQQIALVSDMPGNDRPGDEVDGNPAIGPLCAHRHSRI